MFGKNLGLIYLVMILLCVSNVSLAQRTLHLRISAAPPYLQELRSVRPHLRYYVIEDPSASPRNQFLIEIQSIGSTIDKTLDAQFCQRKSVVAVYRDDGEDLRQPVSPLYYSMANTSGDCFFVYGPAVDDIVDTKTRAMKEAENGDFKGAEARVSRIMASSIDDLAARQTAFSTVQSVYDTMYKCFPSKSRDVRDRILAGMGTLAERLGPYQQSIYLDELSQRLARDYPWDRTALAAAVLEKYNSQANEICDFIKAHCDNLLKGVALAPAAQKALLGFSIEKRQISDSLSLEVAARELRRLQEERASSKERRADAP